MNTSPRSPTWPKALRRVRNAIRKTVPAAEEMISYNIPAYRLPGGPMLYFAGWKQHYSLYPATGQLVAAFRDELAGRLVSKGTIRFPLSEPVPVKLIASIARFRAAEVTGGAKTKVPAVKKR